MIDLRGNIPVFLTITDGKVHDVKAAPLVPIEADGIYVVDRGYVDFAWLWCIHQTNAFFVTRLKTSIKWTRVLSHPVNKDLGLRADQEILLASARLKKLYPQRLRKISFRDEIQGRTLVFITNNFTLPADTIAALYKARWEIELFFKWIKQHLRIKAFFGTSENAVKSQIWIAISVYVLVAIIKKRLDLTTDLYAILQILSLTLFEKTPLDQLLTDIHYKNANSSMSNQLNLFD